MCVQTTTDGHQTPQIAPKCLTNHIISIGMLVCRSMNKLTTTAPNDTQPAAAAPTKPPKLNPKQRKFIELYYLDKQTVGNIYQSAIKAGFSRSYARVMTTEARALQWIQQAKGYMTQMDIDLIRFKLEQEALGADASRDRIRALELLGKNAGMFVDRSESDVRISFQNSVPRPTLDMVSKEVIDGEVVG